METVRRYGKNKLASINLPPLMLILCVRRANTNPKNIIRGTAIPANSKVLKKAFQNIGLRKSFT